MKIYTKTGDKGKTSLFTGERVSKAHGLIESFGTLDELNTQIGALISSLQNEPSKNFAEGLTFLKGLQSQIFSLGSYLASDFQEESHISLVKEWVQDQEKYMDKMDAELAPLKNFILPGGAMSACKAHSCRVLARKTERLVVGLDLTEKTEPVVVYLNRLSDFFFMFARWVNFSLDVEEPIWKG